MKKLIETYYPLAVLDEYPVECTLTIKKMFNSKETAEKYINELSNFRLGKDSYGIYWRYNNKKGIKKLRKDEFEYELKIIKKEKIEIMESLPPFDINQMANLKTLKDKEEWIINNPRMITDDDMDILEISLENYLENYLKLYPEENEVKFCFSAYGVEKIA